MTLSNLTAEQLLPALGTNGLVWLKMNELRDLLDVKKVLLITSHKF